MKDEQALRGIKGGFREVAASLDWLARKKRLDDEGWDEVLGQLEKVKLARQRYLEGEYELAIDELPQF